MRKPLMMYKWMFICFFIFISSMAFSQNNKPGMDKKSMQNEETIKERLKKNEKLELDLERLLYLVLRNNLDVKKALLNYKESEIALKKYRSKFDYSLFINPDYSSVENSPDNPASIFQGTKTERFNVDAGIFRKFRTGTRVQIGINGIYQNVMGAEIDSSMGSYDLGGKGYQSGFMVSISQELLKNMFGVSDRLNEKILANNNESNKRLVKHYLANLLVEALVGYWNVLIAEDNLETVKISLKSTIDIRDLVIRKQTLGLSEKEELLDWNSKVLQSTNRLEIAQKNLFDARQAVLRTLNLEESTDFDIVQTFSTTAPEVKVQVALKDALLNRADLANLRSNLKNFELECKIASCNMEPALKMKLSAGSVDYSENSYSSTYNDINRQWSLGFELTYPLGNNESEATMTKAMLNYKRGYIELKQLEKEIKDQIDSLVKECEVMFSVYQKTKKSSEYSKSYYNQVFKKFKQGRYDAVKLKLSLDNYINLRQQELKSLVDYNISLLRRDLARSVIFKNFNINIDSFLN
ncbi:MAG: TolC family protein [Spirochaetota bacterium]|nr:TolC family protein [Spirochaetota bacterium]